MQDLPRHHTIRESSHHIINPLSPEKLRQLGEALFLEENATMLDLACGKGEMLSSWARQHGIYGTGVDLSSIFIDEAKNRAAELGVTNRVEYIHGDASEYVTAEPVDIAACLGATWIGDGVPGTIDLLQRSLKPGGIMLIGHPYWRQAPDSPEVLAACEAESESTWQSLPDLIASMQEYGYDLIEMMLADQDSWDRYVAAQWRNIRAFIDANPDDELTPSFREELNTAPVLHTKFQREYLGWGIFALKRR